MIIPETPALLILESASRDRPERFAQRSSTPPSSADSKTGGELATA
jgi:hypothetical protein